MFPTLALFAVSVLAQSGIETKYDKFRDYTAYRMDLGKTEDEDDGGHDFSLSAHHKGEERKALGESDSVTLLVYHYGPRWLYLQQHDVIMMEGRNKFDIETHYAHDLSIKYNEVNEFIHIQMTIGEARKRLKSGKDWEIKIGYKEPLPLGPKARRRILEFLDFVQKQ
jgi:hypothetical protein